MGPAKDFGLSPGLGTGGAIEGSEVCVWGGECGKVGCSEFWEEGTRTKGDSGCHHQSYITAWGREEQGLSQGTKEGEKGGGGRRGIQVVKWAGLGLGGRWQERREYLANEWREPVAKEGGLFLGAESVEGGRPCERGTEAQSLHLMDFRFVSRKMWDLDQLVSKLPSGSDMPKFL